MSTAALRGPGGPADATGGTMGAGPRPEVNGGTTRAGAPADVNGGRVGGWWGAAASPRCPSTSLRGTLDRGEVTLGAIIAVNVTFARGGVRPCDVGRDYRRQRHFRAGRSAAV